MDLATLIGLIGAFAIVFYAMFLGGDLGLFLNTPGLLIVLVGSTFTVLIKFGLNQFIGAVKVLVKAFKFKLDAPHDLIAEVVELADVARKGGLLSLEGKEVSNSFLFGGIQPLSRWPRSRRGSNTTYQRNEAKPGSSRDRCQDL